MERRWLSYSFGGVLAVLVACLARPVHAEEKARLVYARGTGADDCPSEVDLWLWVVARLGYDPFSPQASRVVLARIEAVDSNVQGSIELIDAQGMSSGRRELASPRGECGQLSRAMALSISLAIDPERASAREAAPVTAPQPSPVTPAPRRERMPARLPTPAPQPGRAFTGAALVAATGVLPGLALGGSVWLGLRWRPASLALEGRVLQSLGDDLAPRGALRGLLIAPGVVGCGLLHDLALCLVGQVGVQRLGARDVSRPRTNSALFLGAGARLTWRLPLGGRVTPAFGLEAMLNLSRNSARFSDALVWTAPVASGAATIGLDLLFL